MPTSIVHSLLGGALIGLSCALVLGFHGRIAGISGIVRNSLQLQSDKTDGRLFRSGFLVGLIGLGVVLAMVVPRALGPAVASWWQTLIAGGLVGIGASLSNGCTSGHGICGIGRGSTRSLVAVPVFMVTAAITVALVAGQPGGL
jgi:uncharacterized membrane protein YedE/YeeE